MKIETVAQLVPGTVFLEVEAFRHGRWFQINGPYVVIDGPLDKEPEPTSRRRAREDEVLPNKWPPRAEKWFAVVCKYGDNQKNAFPISVPSQDGVAIVRGEGDHSAFIVYTPETEKKLRELKSFKEYRAFAGV